MRPTVSAVQAVVRRHMEDLVAVVAAARKVPRSVFRALRREFRELGMSRGEARRAARAVRRQAKRHRKEGKRNAGSVLDAIDGSPVDVLGIVIELAAAALSGV